jgi:hypothetical protein
LRTGYEPDLLSTTKNEEKSIIKKVSCVPTSLPEKKGTVTVDFPDGCAEVSASLNQHNQNLEYTNQNLDYTNQKLVLH